MDRVGAANVTIVIGPLTAGAPAQAPFDVILLNGATEILPQSLCRQLKDGGRLACVFGRAPGRATVYRSVSDAEAMGRRQGEMGQAKGQME